MNAKIHALQVEIKTIENMLNGLTGAIQQSAMEELKNRRFELDMLKRNALRITQQPVAEDAAVYA